MKKYSSILLLAFFLFLSFPSKCQELNAAEILCKKGHVVKSTINDKNYQLYICLPAGYNPDEAVRYPVLYILDANYSYPIVSSVHELLDSSGEIEKVIIVAIGDEDQSIQTWLISRTADYTPSNDPNANADIARGMNLPVEKVKSGEASAFLETLRKDIIPFVDKQYKTTTDRGIAGHSLGGLFTGYCLFNAPDLFRRYGMSSPSFLWNNGEILSAEKTFAAKRKKLDAVIFISVGSLEPEIMFPPVNSFISTLKEHKYEGLSLTTHVFENETHISVLAASISRSLRILYGVKRQ